MSDAYLSENGLPRGTRHSHTPSPVRNPQGEITPSLGLDWVFIPKKKKRRSCVGPAQYPSMSLPRDQGEVARGLAQMKVVLNSANHSECVQRGTTRRPDILWRSCGLPRFKMKTPCVMQPPGEVRRPDGRGTSGKVPKVNQSSSGSSPFEMTYSRHRLRASAWAALIASDASRPLGASPLML